MLSPLGHPGVFPREWRHQDYCSSWKKTLQTCSGLVLAVMHKHISNSLGSEEKWSGWIPPRLPLHFPRRLSKSESCCKAFQLGQTGIFPTERLLLSLFPSRCVSLAVADARSRGSGCAHRLQPRGLSNGGLRNTRELTQGGISKALTPSRATFSINSSVSLLRQSFRLREKMWVFNVN